MQALDFMTIFEVTIQQLLFYFECNLTVCTVPVYGSNNDKRSKNLMAGLMI